MLKEGTDCFSPDDVRRIIRAARSGLEGSLDAVCMLDDDVSLFTHAFPDADENERRAHCQSTLLEYEESMRAWEEARNSGELDSDSDSSEDEDELTGSELLRDLDPPAPCPPADTIPTARSGRLEWPKKVLEQTNLVSSIAAEIERNTNRADWDAECCEGCQKLLQREVQRMGAISDDRGQEEVSVLTELEVQRWVDEALENAARATKSILEKFASLGVHRPNQDSGEASDFDIADSKAAQAVMRTVKAYPLTDAQLERVVKLALGKRVLEAAMTKAKGGPPKAAVPVARANDGSLTRPEVMSDDERESHRADSTEPEGSPSAKGTERPATPDANEAATEETSGAPATQPPAETPPGVAATTPSGKKKRSRAARKAAKAAATAGDASSVASGEQEPAQEETQQCPVFGCTRGHDPGDCPTFLDMTPKERLDMVHAKQLCLLCLRHPLSVGCEVAGKGVCCPWGDCDRPHHAALHEMLKAGGPSLPKEGANPPKRPMVAVDGGIPGIAKLLGSLLEDLGIDPNDLEVRIGIRQAGEPGRSRAEATRGLGETEADTAKMAGQLLEALTSLCQAGERLADSAIEGGPRARRGRPTEIGRQRPRMIQSGPRTGSTSCTPGRNSEWMESQGLTARGREGGIGAMGERRRALEGNEFAHGGRGGLERHGGLPRVVILTPEGGQLINMGIGRGYVFTVISQEAAARYAMHRSKLPEPLMIAGPAGQQVRAVGRCEIAFPQEKAVGGKMIIFAFEVEKLEELHETSYGGPERWHLQLGEEDEGHLRRLRVAQTGDRPYCELTLERVTLDPARVSRSTWKFLVCKGRQMTETVWLTAVRAWNMPVSRLSADAATRLGLTEKPNDWCQVRPCNAAGRQLDGFLARIASVLEIAPPGYPTEKRPREMNFRTPDVVIGTKDWESVEGFLRNVEPDRMAELKETRKYHMRVVLRNEERWYLNVLVSETARQSRILSTAATMLGRESVHDERIHFRDMNGKEVSIAVDVVSTMEELLVNENPCHGLPKPHMVLCPEDERCIKETMLTGWKCEADLSRGWASQGKKKIRPAPEAGEKKSGEKVFLKHLKVNTEPYRRRISALFNENAPDTLIGYGAAAILGLKGGRTRRQVTTGGGTQGRSYAWYDVPLQDEDGRVRQIRAYGVLRTARVKNEGENGKVLGDSPGGATGPAQLWECIDLIVGRDNQDRRPENTLGWSGRRPKEGYAVRSAGDPGDYIKVKIENPNPRN
jgi:hypothetical protein